jgi:hypothetical protein
MTTPAQPDTGEAGAAPDTGTAPETGTEAPETTAPDTGEEIDWKAEAEKYKALSRKHEKRARDNKAALDDFQAKATPAEGEEDWKAKYEEAESRATEVTYKDAVRDAASDAGADYKALIDSQSFRDAVSDQLGEYFDDDELRDAVNTAAKEFAKQDRFRAARTGPARSGTEINGGPPGLQQVTEAELANMTPEQIVAAQEAGQLNALLGRT